VQRPRQQKPSPPAASWPSKVWSAGDDVKKGTVLGAVQSLGAMTDVVAPIDGVLRDVLVAGGAPVEYGQALFAIEKR